MTAHLHSSVAESARSTVDSQYESDVIPLREPLYRQAMRMTRNHADAEDLVQDNMMKAYAGLATCKENNLRGWLFRIMTNVHRGAAGHCHQSTTETPYAEQHPLERLGDNKIRDAMRVLPAQFRAVVYYADVECFSSKEIANLMQTPVGVVPTSLHRGRSLLRDLLADVNEQRWDTTVDDAA